MNIFVQSTQSSIVILKIFRGKKTNICDVKVMYKSLGNRNVTVMAYRKMEKRFSSVSFDRFGSLSKSGNFEDLTIVIAIKTAITL